jgi:hypothetical protein
MPNKKAGCTCWSGLASHLRASLHALTTTMEDCAHCPLSIMEKNEGKLKMPNFNMLYNCIYTTYSVFCNMALQKRGQ